MTRADESGHTEQTVIQRINVVLRIYRIPTEGLAIGEQKAWYRNHIWSSLTTTERSELGGILQAYSSSRESSCDYLRTATIIHVYSLPSASIQ